VSPVFSGGRAHSLLFKAISLSNVDLSFPVGGEVKILDFRIPDAE